MQQTQEEVRAEMEQWLRDNRNKNTEATYSSAWRQFVRWATEVANPQRAAAAHVDLQCPSEVDIALYMRYIVETKNGAMQTVEGALAGIADHFRFAEQRPVYGEFIAQTRRYCCPPQSRRNRRES